jgi:hypothetical protein
MIKLSMLFIVSPVYYKGVTETSVDLRQYDALLDEEHGRVLLRRRLRDGEDEPKEGRPVLAIPVENIACYEAEAVTWPEAPAERSRAKGQGRTAGRPLEAPDNA